MINADSLIAKIDEFNTVCAKNALEPCKKAVERFDLAIKEFESHRTDIENAGKVLKHFGRMHLFPIKVYRPDVYGEQAQRVEFRYDELDGGYLRCGYVIGNFPNIGWLSDGSIQIGSTWSIKIEDVRAGIMNGLDGKVVDGYPFTYQQVVDALFTLAMLYPDAEKDFVKYFESLGR